MHTIPPRLPRQYEWMLIDAVRYALPRKSYIASRAVNAVREQWDTLQPGTRNVIASDIAEARAPLPGEPSTRARDSYEREWDSLLSWIKKKVGEDAHRLPRREALPWQVNHPTPKENTCYSGNVER